MTDPITATAPDRSYLAMLYDDLAGYEAMAAQIEGLIAAGNLSADDLDWQTKRLKGYQWNIQVTHNKIAREQHAEEQQKAAT